MRWGARAATTLRASLQRRRNDVEFGRRASRTSSEQPTGNAWCFAANGVDTVACLANERAIGAGAGVGAYIGMLEDWWGTWGHMHDW